MTTDSEGSLSASPTLCDTGGTTEERIPSAVAFHRVSPRLPHTVRRLVAEFVIADRERRGSDFSDVETRQGRDGLQLDHQLAEILERYGLAGRVQLHVGDSRTAEQPEPPVDLL